MIKPAFLYEQLKKNGVEFMLGVPDSLLKDFCSYAFDQGNELIAANEGGALSIAAGYHLATGKIPVVYLQNSGFGNLVNPLTSLVDKEVYAIPVLLLIGWRGQPGVKDEPQHLAQGKTQEAVLNALEIPYAILSRDSAEVEEQVSKAFENMQKNSCSYAFLVPPGSFESYQLNKQEHLEETYSLTREEVLDELVQKFAKEDIIVSTTGKTSRELFELRKKYAMAHHQDFLTVGSMGHASQITLGIALEKQNRNVFCIDGDGSVIMHMGSLAIVGEQQLVNFKHILINNGAHESVGGQPTAGFSIDFGKIAEGCGYRSVFKIETQEEISGILDEFFQCKGPALLEIMTRTGSRKDLGRPTIAPVNNKTDFMNFLKREV